MQPKNFLCNTLRKLLMLAVVFSLYPLALKADSCSEKQVTIPAAITLDRTHLLVYISTSSHTSVIAELAISSKNEISKDISITSGALTFDEAAKLLSGPEQIICSLDKGVAHFFNPSILAVKRNPMNHSFHFFKIPDNVGLFQLEFNNRLNREVSSHDGGVSMSGPGGGVIVPGSDALSLNAEVLHDLTARELFLIAARQQPMSLMIEVPLKTEKDIDSALVESMRSLKMGISR